MIRRKRCGLLTSVLCFSLGACGPETDDASGSDGGSSQDGAGSSENGGATSGGGGATGDDGTGDTGATGGTDGGWPDECEELTFELVTDLRGTWQGTLTYVQSLAGETKEMDVPAILDFAAYSAPQAHMAGLGFVGDWSTYTNFDEDGHLVMDELFAAGGEGDAWAYNATEIDGPANALTISDAEVCASQTGFFWRYHAQFKLVDLVDYQLYDYEGDDVPIAELEVEETYLLRDGEVAVEARATGSNDAGEITLSLSGIAAPA